MEGAIQFKTSHLDKVFYGLSFLLASYWLWSADIPLLLYLMINSAVAVLAIIYYLQCSNYLIGSFSLGSSGQLTSVASRILEERQNYQVKLRQRLPWCLDIRLESKGKTRRQLVWVDTLSSEDWRRFRVFLAEECQQGR